MPRKSPKDTHVLCAGCLKRIPTRWKSQTHAILGAHKSPSGYDCIGSNLDIDLSDESLLIPCSKPAWTDPRIKSYFRKGHEFSARGPAFRYMPPEAL